MNSDQKINKTAQLLSWLQAVEIGEGDLTTESVAPHSLHVTGKLISDEDGLFCGARVVTELLAPVANQLQLVWHVHDGEELSKNATIFEFSGNGAEILKNRRLITFLVGRLSGLATATRAAVEQLKKYGKKLTAGHDSIPFLEEFDREALQLGGMEIHHQGLYDNVYLTPLHFAYAGAPETVLNRVSEELAEVRKVVKIEVEVNSVALFRRINPLGCDVIHLVNLCKDDIRTIFETCQPNRKPILHLNSMADFEPEYADYFFRYVVLKDLHQQLYFLKNSLIINERSNP